MMLANPRLRIVVVLVILIGAFLFVLVNFTSVSNLHAVTFNGEPLEDFSNNLGLSPEKPILSQPLDSLGTALLARDDVARVDIDYNLPNGLEIITNRFEPVCFALDMRSGAMVGLTTEGRVVPINPEQSDWELPMITSVKTGKLYDYTSDVRVRVIVQNLIHLQDEQPDLARLITEIDLAKPDYVRVTLSGLPYTLRTTSSEFDHQMTGFLQFLERYHPTLENTREIDLRFDDMIIQVGKGR